MKSFAHLSSVALALCLVVCGCRILDFLENIVGRGWDVGGTGPPGSVGLCPTRLPEILLITVELWDMAISCASQCFRKLNSKSKRWNEMESKVGFPSCDLLIVCPISGGGLQDPPADSRDGIVSAPGGLSGRLPQISTNPHCTRPTVIGGFAEGLLC